MNWDGTERRREDPRHAENIRRLDDIKECLDDITKSLHGNGRPGVVSKVDVLESDFRTMKTTLTDHFREDAKNFAVLFKHLYLGTGGLAVLIFVLKFAFK